MLGHSGILFLFFFTKVQITSSVLIRVLDVLLHVLAFDKKISVLWQP